MDIKTKRLLKDIKYLKSNPIDGVFINVNQTDITKLTAMIIGPSDTPYEDGMFFFSIRIPEQYPFVPPKVKFLNPDPRIRFHPNMYEQGKVCLSILGTWNGPGWTSVQTLASLLVVIQSLFQKDPLKCEPGHENDKIDLIQRYNDLITHEVLRCNLCMEMNLQRFFPLFEAEMKEHVLSNRERISKRLEIYKKIPAKDIQAPNPFRRMKIRTKYNLIFTGWNRILQELGNDEKNDSLIK